MWVPETLLGVHEASLGIVFITIIRCDMPFLLSVEAQWSFPETTGHVLSPHTEGRGRGENAASMKARH